LRAEISGKEKDMETMTAWWSALQPLNQWFYVAAAIFGVFFLWQLVAAIVGIGGGDAGIDPAADHISVHDAVDTVATFQLLSVRSIVAFFTLFFWGGAFYMNAGVPTLRALVYALLWGIAAMVFVSLAFHFLRRMSSSGNLQIASCVGQTATVYLDIPAGGDGEVRLQCSGVMTHFKARAAHGVAVKAGTSVRVLKVTGPNSLEVEPTA